MENFTMKFRRKFFGYRELATMVSSFGVALSLSRVQYYVNPGSTKVSDYYDGFASQWVVGIG
jgi:hypothetical protein